MNSPATGTPNPRTPRFYTVAEAARILRVAPITLYRQIDANQFPAVRVRRRVVIPATTIDTLHDQALATNTVIDAATLAPPTTPDDTRATGDNRHH